MIKCRQYIGVLVLVCLLMFLGGCDVAQDDLGQKTQVIISVTLPEDQEIYRDAVEQFEKDYPNIGVHIVPIKSYTEKMDPDDPVDKYLQSAEMYIEKADIILLDSSEATPELIRAGFLQDMSRLISRDSTIDVNDYPESVWQSYKWDDGLYMVPLVVKTHLIQYDRQTFDSLSLPYPNGNWTITDLDKAVKGLLSSGLPMDGLDEPLLLRSLVTQPLFDPLTSRSLTELQELLETWKNLKDLLERYPVGNSSVTPPLMVHQVGSGFCRDNSEEIDYAQLPGGRSPFDVQGLAINAGTQHLEQAYQLVSYLSWQVELIDTLSGIPARRSLRDDSTLEKMCNDSELFELVENAIDNGTSPAETRFSRHLPDVVSKLSQDCDIGCALDAVEGDVRRRLDEAEQRQGIQIKVKPAQSECGETCLHFGVVSFEEQLPDQPEWEKIIKQFNSSEEADFELQITQEYKVESLGRQFDCYYSPDNLVSETNLDYLIPLDSLMKRDPTRPFEDYAPRLLSKVQVNSLTWALPINIDPMVVLVDEYALNQAGLPLPDSSWTINELEEYLTNLQPYMPEHAHLSFRNPDNNDVFVMIASYGGELFDYGATPPTVNFTTVENRSAIQSVLELARTKNFRLGSDSSDFIGQGVFRVDYLSQLGASVSTDVDTQLVPLPHGLQTAALTYSLGAGYISAQTEEFSSCYELLKLISQSTALIAEMPARNSVLLDPQFENLQGEPLFSTLWIIWQTVNNLTTIHVDSSSFLNGDRIGDRIWFDKVYEDYLENGGDLTGSLEQAQDLTQDFLNCRSAITVSQEVTNESVCAYLTQLRQCATVIDPSVADSFETCE